MPFTRFAPLRVQIATIRAQNQAGGLVATNQAVNDLCLQLEQLLSDLEQLLRDMSITTE